jgi:hypothetical protein
MNDIIEITGCEWCGKSISYNEDGEGYLDHMAECAVFKARCEARKAQAMERLHKFRQEEARSGRPKFLRGLLEEVGADVTTFIHDDI